MPQLTTQPDHAVGVSKAVDQAAAGDAGRSTRPHLAQRIMDGAAAIVAVLIALIVLRVLWVHLTDLYWLNFVSGAWLTQVNEAMHGKAYPVLFDGERVGGTRFMAIPIALHAALAWVLEAGGLARAEALIVAGRLLSLMATVALVYMIYCVGRRFGAPRGFAALAAVAVLLTTPGQLSVHSIRYDAPSAALQLGALLWATSKRPRWIWIGAMLGVALFCKANAVWAGLGLTAWLLWTDRKALGRLYLGGLAAVVPLALALHLWSGGRAWQNFFRLTFGGVDDPTRGAVGSLQAITDYWIRLAKLGVLLLPLSLVGWIALASRWREGGPFALAAIWAGLVAWYSFNDKGVSSNHLLDLLVIVAIGVAAAGAWASQRRWWAATGAGAVLVAACLAALIKGHLIQEALAPGGSPLDMSDEVSAAVLMLPQPDGRPIFADDSFIPIIAGERPDIMDMFMLHRIARQDRAVMESVIQKIEGHAYRALVLPDYWIETEVDIDPELMDVIKTHYRPVDAAMPLLVMLPVDPLDPLDPVDPLDPLDPVEPAALGDTR